MSRPRGRPPRGKATVSREDILATALHLLDTKGVEAFTMRALADRLQVNPMTIYHHFGDRDGLIGAMTERAYSGVTAPESGESVSRIEALLRSYHDQVMRYPGLTLLIFSRPAVFPQQAQRITEEIARLLAEAGLSPERVRLWINILVDFTHGAAVATAMGGRAQAEGEFKDAGAGSDNGYADALAELLCGLRKG